MEKVQKQEQELEDTQIVEDSADESAQEAPRAQQTAASPQQAVALLQQNVALAQKAVSLPAQQTQQNAALGQSVFFSKVCLFAKVYFSRN